jgi:hypothetical protein
MWRGRRREIVVGTGYGSRSPGRGVIVEQSGVWWDGRPLR